VEPSETLFSSKGAKGLPISSLHAMKKWKWLHRLREMRLSSPGRERRGLSSGFGKRPRPGYSMKCFISLFNETLS
jgi:hypothetical protein